MSRQNPHYSGDQTHRNAMALITAVLDGDDGLIDNALRQALDGTDHTLPAYVLAQSCALQLRIMAHAVDVSPEVLARELAGALATVLENQGPEEG